MYLGNTPLNFGNTRFNCIFRVEKLYGVTLADISSDWLYTPAAQTRPCTIRAFIIVLDLKHRGRVAQLVEQCPFKAWVAGSNPAALTIRPTLALRRISVAIRLAVTGKQ
jgi:hypothetical protein